MAPYVTLWALLGFGELQVPSVPGCVVATELAALPSSLRGLAKSSDEALWRKEFNAFCRAQGLGKLCFQWAKEKSCKCKATTPFEHPKREEKKARLEEKMISCHYHIIIISLYKYYKLHMRSYKRRGCFRCESF